MIYLLMLQPTCVALSQEQVVSERLFVHPPENVQNPSSELTSIITGLQIPDLKMELYTHDRQCPVRFYSNGDLLVNRGPACWRDTVAFNCEEYLMLGTPMHSDPCFLTIGLQDFMGGLQFRVQNRWLISNDRFKSVVVVGQVGSQASVARLFYPSTANYNSKPYGPIYRETNIAE
ncbi:hypothetical protein Peur_051197 [Populus x canadensis]